MAVISLPLFCCLLRDHRNQLFVAFGGAENNGAIDLGKKCVVAAHANARTGMHFCAALADDDVAGNHSLATRFISNNDL